MSYFNQSFAPMSLNGLSKNNVNFIEYILSRLDGQMTRPTLYGWYHLLCLALVLALCTIVFFKARNLSDKHFNLILGGTAVLLLTFEVYKQLNYSYDWANDTWKYQWYAFPFQFCSTPMYVMLAAVLIKNQKIRNALYAFLGTYGLFAGAAVMFYPGDVFIETIGINVQTMLHHGAMVVIGVFMYVSGRVKISHKSVFHALPVFATLLLMALGMNILYHFFGDSEQTFNMFFISPYYPCTLPVLSSIFELVPYPVFLLIYTFGFTSAAYIMLLLAMLVQKIEIKVKEKKAS